MRRLEERYPDAVAVVGVHSGKYHAERETARIREASIRLGATHPIVNDRQFRVWRSYAVNAWPTLVAIDPRGHVVGQHAGEFTLEQLEPFVERMIAEAESAGTLVRSVEHWPADAPAVAPGALRYPGGLALDGDPSTSLGAGRIAIADTGRHRVLVGRLDDEGTLIRVEHVVGGGAPGFRDGAAEDARFDGPQGLAFGGDTLYVADARNHVVRAIDLALGETGGANVRTVAGTGRQLRTSDDLRAGALASPWDVAVVDERLFIAMAGSHQLWSVGTDGAGLRVHSGTRAEALVDGPHHEAALAQPMALALAPDDGRLWFVDPESSAVRWADVDPAGGVGTIVGTGLFDFGDRDGVGEEVLMQHQQGIARAADGRLLVADSYNDALKWVDPATRAATTWVRGLHEPSAVRLTATHAWVADTNAHRIVRVALATGVVEEVEVRM